MQLKSRVIILVIALSAIIVTTESKSHPQKGDRITISSDVTTFKNPILSGFHPDPSITRAGECYYLVNSSFEWYPALPIHRSRDLVNWEHIGYGIDRVEQMQFKDGLYDSGGTFAPTI